MLQPPAEFHQQQQLWLRDQTLTQFPQLQQQSKSFAQENLGALESVDHVGLSYGSVLRLVCVNRDFQYVFSLLRKTLSSNCGHESSALPRGFWLHPGSDTAPLDFSGI